MNTLARIKQAGKNFEIIVDLDDALKFKKGNISSIEAEGDRIFTDSKKGFVASKADLEKAFGTDSISEITERIIKKGEILLTHEYRNEEKEKKLKQVIDFLTKNAIDPQTKLPQTETRIRNALEESKINIKNEPIEKQIDEIIKEVSKIIPIKIETKKIKITIPASFTGKTYGLVNEYKQSEKWLDNGNLEIVVDVPAGIIMNFYDKLNSMTQGSALTEEIKE